VKRAPRSELAIAVVAAAIAWLALVPSAFPGDAPRSGLRFPPPASADFLRNVALFVPMGGVLALRGLRATGVSLAAVAFSAGLEALQLVVPGRYVSPWDVAANGLGAVLGAAAARALPPALSSPARAARLALRACAAAALALVATAWLAAPALPAAPYFAHWVPDLAHFVPYAGRLERATLDGQALAHGPLPDSTAVRTRLARPCTLSLRLRPGRPPPGLAGIFLVTDIASREVLLVAVDGDDVVLHTRDRAAALGLETLALRADRALAGVAAGVPVDLEVRRLRDGSELRVDGGAPLRLGATPGQGWALLAPRWRLHATARSALDAAWIALLWLGPGIGLASVRRTGWALAGLAALMAALPAVSGMLASPIGEWLGAAAGLAAGAALGRSGRGAAQASASEPPR
jgi:hypothetical protein